MALFNESLAPRFNNLIRRLHSMKVGAPAPQVQPEISHAIILENDRFENLILAGVRPWVFFATVVANAGAVGQIELLNPIGTNILCVVTLVVVQNSGAALGSFELRRDPAAAGTPVNNQSRDDRNTPVTCQNRILNTGAGPSGVLLERVTGAVPANVDVIFKTTPYVVMPSHRLAVFNTTVNSPLQVAMAGYERQLEESEATP